MYRRFLNNDDYLGVVTADALSQMTRGNDDRFIQAEEAAEMSLVEYLSENYEVEQELRKGKYIAGYDRKITYPVGVHIYHEGRICEVIRAISDIRLLRPLNTGKNTPGRKWTISSLIPSLKPIIKGML